jgi:hypothetical protein
MKRTNFAYTSAIAIIVLLITLSQAAIQLTLQQETITRNLATEMSRQELHTQRLLRNSLLLLAANPMDKSFNPLQIDPVAQLKADLTFIEQTQEDLTTNSQVAEPMRALFPDYSALDKAGHQILLDYAKKDRKDLAKQISPVFVHDQAYLAGTFAAYLVLTQQADDLVTRVKWLEISIYIINLAVIAFEVFWVVLPAYQSQNDAIAELRAQVGTLQESMNAKRASAE